MNQQDQQKIRELAKEIFRELEPGACTNRDRNAMNLALDIVSIIDKDKPDRQTVSGNAFDVVGQSTAKSVRKADEINPPNLRVAPRKSPYAPPGAPPKSKQNYKLKLQDEIQISTEYDGVISIRLDDFLNQIKEHLT